MVPIAGALAALGVARRTRTELPIHDRQTDVIVGAMGLVLALLLHAVLLQRYALHFYLLRLDLVAMWTFAVSASIAVFGLRPVIRFGWVWLQLGAVFALPYYLIVIILVRQKVVADVGDARCDKFARPRTLMVDTLTTYRPFSLKVFPARMIYHVENIRLSGIRPVDRGYGVGADIFSAIDDKLLVTWYAIQWTWTNGPVAQRILVIAVDNHEDDAPFPEPTGAVGPTLNSMFSQRHLVRCRAGVPDLHRCQRRHVPVPALLHRRDPVRGDDGDARGTRGHAGPTHAAWPLNDPSLYGVRYLLAVPRTGRGLSDALNQRYPTLYETGADVATLELEIPNDGDSQPDWRLYRVNEPAEPRA